jgi:hypothetical protein
MTADKTKGFSFKADNKNVLAKTDTPQKTSKIGRKPKAPNEAIVKKVLLTLTADEYEKFKTDYDASGFPSESSFLKYQVKNNNII